MPSRNDRGAILSDAHASGHHIRVRCTACRITRFFLPTDMITLFGDIEVHHLERKLFCSACRSREYLHVNNVSMTAAEKARATLRRLERIKTIRRPVWRDEKM